MIHEEINKAVEVLKRGGIILYPTDTVWGIGCDATNPEAVQKIYDLKGSVNKKGMIVLLDEPLSVGRYIRRVPEVAWDLMELSDKPLTLILDGAVGVAPNLIPAEGSLFQKMIRMPARMPTMAEKAGSLLWYMRMDWGRISPKTTYSMAPLAKPRLKVSPMGPISPSR